MLRSPALALAGLIVLSASSLFADDEEKPKSIDKSEVNKGEAKDGEKKVDKEQQGVAVIGNETDYYSTSPAQGRPADGKLKAGTKVKVLEKAGSYVRVAVQIEVYVPIESLKPGEKQEGVKKGDGDKGVAEKAAVEKKAAASKEGGKGDSEKKKDDDR